MSRQTSAQKSSSASSAISPRRDENYPEWYLSVIKAADLAEHSDVRGCMVIKPWGYGIWERIHQLLDRKFKDTGHKNAYFPLLIPISFLQKEAEHVEGFAKECAVVTHRRLVTTETGKLAPANPLEEPLIIRPTSETIIGASFAKWVKSYRDLPILINQWANVMRWEMRTRLFLRTAEFLWQEGHTVHETAEEALLETRRMLDVYTEFATQALAMPVIPGEKTKSERFPGAVQTFSIEAMMQDGKALQAGTSHFLGQNFARAQNIKFLGRDNREHIAWTTSWGVSTRLIGGLIMTHADDNGMVVPPRVAPTHVVLLPVIRKPEDAPTVYRYIEALWAELRTLRWGPDQERIESEIDRKDIAGGEKFWSSVKKGVPLIVEIGLRETETNTVCLTRRDELDQKRQSLPRAQFIQTLPALLEEIQQNLFKRAQDRMNARLFSFQTAQELLEFFGHEEDPGTQNDSQQQSPQPSLQSQGQNQQKTAKNGFALVHCADTPEALEILSARKLSIRCIPLTEEEKPGKCILTGQPSSQRVIIARAY